ncbi:hypothetical protein [Natrarchaeobius chitinivorans]|uniref:Uncharacterized protein n=1 Tax=Natrarchaeobius chitinivorans TaxID=1679083 RepID=A0A3N6LWU1_NATCH|nr:hypothetical protein [Natrarchaeobius chitinivorans]RQG93377.1 hypothetical protein EA473_15205 [Natrarchaeobius chitinivorans]
MTFIAGVSTGSYKNRRTAYQPSIPAENRYRLYRCVRTTAMTTPWLMTVALFVIVILCLIALLYISTQWE